MEGMVFRMVWFIMGLGLQGQMFRGKDVKVKVFIRN